MFSLVTNTGSTDTAYTDTGRTPDTKYYYRVFAINTIGSSAPSNIANATTNQIIPPVPPGNTSPDTGTSSPNGSLVSTGQNIVLIVGAAVLQFCSKRDRYLSEGRSKKNALSLSYIAYDKI